MPFKLCWQTSVGTVFLATALRHYPEKLGLSQGTNKYCIIIIIIITILPSATSTTPSLHIRIWQDGDYHKVMIVPFALILKSSSCCRWLSTVPWSLYLETRLNP